MRFGLVGTGPWATMTHGPGLVAAPGADLVGVWGRDPHKARSLAEELGTTAYESYDALLSDVEAVAFAVPPGTQAELALEAARAGKHLLLDKPVAADVESARRLRDAAAEAGVASVVFFTDRFVEESRAWFDQVRSTDGWKGGWVRWFSALQEPGNPFGASAWRHERGALWDIAPHALSTLDACLGPVTSLSAVGGRGDLVNLTLRHGSGALSTVTLTQFAPPAAEGFEAAVWGETGVSLMPRRPDAFVDALATAAEELVAAAEGASHPLDVGFGTRVVELIAEAQAQLEGEPTR
ncbi:Gfo/Idh/MocA family oxidoreductase [Nocardioides sp. CER19]|uniref:Gfo/Idh/MocA family protein n=1 Tax=Nocardioides sp. CER19 TaxID=3038538 RepID=UPI0024498933|nr:Gfo/Idh/MocA family oxidoreductase [Nocardioides sp. CER19]MDH2415959.1 Gfo/Idh/MocA family oxidoreductase [Nocardioides sp. CER19]